MKDFVAIDFETGNPQRVSACAIGYATVSGGKIVESKSYLIKPIGGHAVFQSKIHGIKEEHTHDKPTFGELYPEIKGIFGYPLVAHSLFDQQVLNALVGHFGISLNFSYTDSSAIAKRKLPNLKNHKLKTLVKHFELQSFKHHDAHDDAVACANIFLKLTDLSTCLEPPPTTENESLELGMMLRDILADNQVSYKEAYELLYWLEDHEKTAKEQMVLYSKVKDVLADDQLDCIEAAELKIHFERALLSLANVGL